MAAYGTNFFNTNDIGLNYNVINENEEGKFDRGGCRTNLNYVLYLSL